MTSLKEKLLAAFYGPTLKNPSAPEMSRPRTNKRKLGKPDGRGRVRQCIGYKQDGQKARFQISDNKTAPAEAMRRLDLIQSLYEHQCERHRVDHWLGWTKQVADKIAQGEPVVDSCIGREPPHRAAIVDQLRSWGIPVIVEDDQLYSQGAATIKNQIVAAMHQSVAGIVNTSILRRGAIVETAIAPSDPLLLAESATLHQALDHYCDDIKATGKRGKNNQLTTNSDQRMRRTRYLKDHHSDIPLWKLNLPQLQRVAAYWRNRPATLKSDRCSKDHARDMLKETWRFLRWLDSHPDYRWVMPRGAGDIKRTPVGLPEDDNGEAFQTITKQTFSPEQLAIIAGFTDAFGRAMIGVCVNCAFGQSEIGQWPTNKFRLNQSHPHSERLRIESTSDDSWIVGKRPKTGVYGEHLLWPQVADAIRPFLDGRDVIPITGRRTPWYRTHAANPQAKFTNWWQELMDDVSKVHPEFPYLPFGSLRDLLPDLLRAQFSDDIASLALQHGQLSDDDLLKCYANHPFNRLFAATRELEATFKPFLDVLAADSDANQK